MPYNIAKNKNCLHTNMEMQNCHISHSIINDIVFYVAAHLKAMEYQLFHEYIKYAFIKRKIGFVVLEIIRE